DEADYYCQAWD
nr:immunoglobulin light chain junction region [Homo sapiens]MCC73681.1 immunoglobulin light chain junction region [Homo sapiens]MCC73684.1 immunoglobulin light chain junction region [Homo sapiens]MCC73686.1 immunoglobulin light chain junction region [Homo sapiens]MCE59855.1 immunoglobulin light chain junction region [Homo sapiens]